MWFRTTPRLGLRARFGAERRTRRERVGNLFEDLVTSFVFSGGSDGKRVRRNRKPLSSKGPICGVVCCVTIKDFL